MGDIVETKLDLTTPVRGIAAFVGRGYGLRDVAGLLAMYRQEQRGVVDAACPSSALRRVTASTLRSRCVRPRHPSRQQWRRF